jgi:gas vesicle protein
MSILATDSVTAYFHDVVAEAIKARQVEATPSAATYLVELLADHARPDSRAGETLARPLTFQLDEALHICAPAERFDKLRVLGDGVLYSCGFFGEHFEARGVDQGYVIGIGTTAYGAASSLLHAPSSGPKPRGDDIFRELADNFRAFVGVLAEIAERTVTAGVQGSRDLVKMYERWLKTGSEGLAQELAAHGLVPVRGAKGGIVQ